MGAPAARYGEGSAPEARVTRQTPVFLAYFIGPMALAVILPLQHWGFLADEPWWAYALVIGASSVSSRLVESWGVTERSPWQVETRLFLHAAGVTAVIYMSGWGPMLGVAYAFGAVEDISQCGSVVWRSALLWSLAGITVGQGLIWMGWAPSFVPRSRAEGLGLAGAFVLAFVIRLAGAADQQKEVAEAALAHQALHDPLTSLPNRQLLVDRLEHAMARNRRSGGPSPVVMFLDLDRFKLVNDSLGHRAGDDLLVQVAERLRALLRESDTLSRFGGDEFVVLCEDIEGQRGVDALARRIVSVFDEPFELGDERVQIGVSVGVAVVDDDVDSCESLLSDADAAMYLAKQQRSGDRVRLFDDATRVAARDRVSTETALHRAIERDELELYYQPLVSFLTGRAEGVEALLRWHHPDGRTLLPEDFLALAERTGLIIPIGEWALVSAVGQVRSWNGCRTPDEQLTLSVNVSPRQLVEPGLTDLLASLIGSTGADAGRPDLRLALELTEAFSPSGDRPEAGRLDELSELGVDLVIDDFGTGNSSLAFVKELPVTMIKLDGMFVTDLGTDPRAEAIVRGVIELAHRLGVRVTAEAVELPRQRDRLKALSCDLGQGFLFGRPRPARALAASSFGGAPSALDGASPAPAG